MKIQLKPPPIGQLLSELVGEEPSRLSEVLGSDMDKQLVGKYVHWDELRHLPEPDGFTHPQWWLATKISRRAAHSLPFADTGQSGFTYSVPNHVLKLIHEIDRDASGRIEVPEPVTSSHTRDRYLVSSLIEESITSSQLASKSRGPRLSSDVLLGSAKHFGQIAFPMSGATTRPHAVVPPTAMDNTGHTKVTSAPQANAG